MYSVTELASSVISTLSARMDCHSVIRDAGGCRVLANMLDPALDSKVVEDVATAVGNMAADCVCRASLQRDGVVTALLNLLRPTRPKRIRVGLDGSRNSAMLLEALLLVAVGSCLLLLALLCHQMRMLRF